MKLGIVLLIVGIIGMKGGILANYLPDIMINNMTYVIAGGVILSLFGMLGIIGLAIGVILAIMMTIGGLI